VARKKTDALHGRAARLQTFRLMQVYRDAGAHDMKAAFAVARPGATGAIRRLPRPGRIERPEPGPGARIDLHALAERCHAHSVAGNTSGRAGKARPCRGRGQPLKRENTSVAFVPPKPKLFDITVSTCTSCVSRRIGKPSQRGSSASMFAEPDRKPPRSISRL
jgi:hypothetical protein